MDTNDNFCGKIPAELHGKVMFPIANSNYRIKVIEVNATVPNLRSWSSLIQNQSRAIVYIIPKYLYKLDTNYDFCGIFVRNYQKRNER